MIHTVTEFTPVDAMKPGNLAQVKFNLELTAKKQRAYPDLQVGDYVRIFYQKDKLDKERHSNWLPNRQRVKEIEESMGQKLYVLGNIRLTQAYVRRDLLKVDPLMRKRLLIEQQKMQERMQVDLWILEALDK